MGLTGQRQRAKINITDYQHDAKRNTDLRRANTKLTTDMVRLYRCCSQHYSPRGSHFKFKTRLIIDPLRMISKIFCWWWISLLVKKFLKQWSRDRNFPFPLCFQKLNSKLSYKILSIMLTPWDKALQGFCKDFCCWPRSHFFRNMLHYEIPLMVSLHCNCKAYAILQQYAIWNTIKKFNQYAD